MNTPDLSKLPGIALSENEPVFNEPWEAQAFALVIGLYEKQAFTWSEWAEVLSKTIAADKNCLPYYELWLKALEEMISQNSILTDDEVLKRQKDWQRALEQTPHGKPIELSNIV